MLSGDEAAMAQDGWLKVASENESRNSEAAARKAIPLCTGVLDYFPDALAEVAKASKAGSDQHHPGEGLHWDRDKSADHADAMLRHLVDRGKVDSDGVRHLGKAAWRCLALLQLEIENDRPAAHMPGNSASQLLVSPISSNSSLRDLQRLPP